MSNETELDLEAFNAFYDEYFAGRSDLSTHAKDFWDAGRQSQAAKIEALTASKSKYFNELLEYASYARDSYSKWEEHDVTGEAEESIRAFDLFMGAVKGEHHYSDCAVHNMPAETNGPCDCPAALASKTER